MYFLKNSSRVKLESTPSTASESSGNRCWVLLGPREGVRSEPKGVAEKPGVRDWVRFRVAEGVLLGFLGFRVKERWGHG